MRDKKHVLAMDRDASPYADELTHAQTLSTLEGVVMYLEPEPAEVPEALGAIHKGMAVLGSSNSDMRVGALVGEGAHAPLAAISEGCGRCSAPSEPAPGVSFRAVGLRKERQHSLKSDKSGILHRLLSPYGNLGTHCQQGSVLACSHGIGSACAA